MTEAVVETEPSPPPKPRRRKPSKPRAPRQVKKRQYRVFRIVATDLISQWLPQGAGVDGMIVEEMVPIHNDQKSAREWIKDNAKSGESYMCASVLFLAKAEMQTAIKFAERESQ